MLPVMFVRASSMPGRTHWRDGRGQRTCVHAGEASGGTLPMPTISQNRILAETGRSSVGVERGYEEYGMLDDTGPRARSRSPRQLPPGLAAVIVDLFLRCVLNTLLHCGPGDPRVCGNLVLP